MLLQIQNGLLLQFADDTHALVKSALHGDDHTQVKDLLCIKNLETHAVHLNN